MDAQVKGSKVAPADTEKQKALQAALAQIEKQFGKGTIMIFSWFSTSESTRFGRELATYVLSELAASTAKKDAKFSAKAEKALIRADVRVREFKVREKMNFYKKAKLANAFMEECGFKVTRNPSEMAKLLKAML